MTASFLDPGTNIRCTAVRCVALLACLAAGCGARSSLYEGASTDSGGSPAPTRFDCRASSSERPMLAARLGPKVYFAYPDRSARDVFTFELPEGTSVAHGAIVARGDRVAAYVVASSTGGAPEPPPFAEIVVLTVDGEVVLRQKVDFSNEDEGWGFNNRLVGNAEGRFVLTLVDAEAGLVVAADGDAVHTFDGRMTGITDPDALGRMVVLDYEAPGGADLRFFDARTGTLTPSKHIEPGPMESDPHHLVGSGLLHLERDPMRLVLEDADGTSTLPLHPELESSWFSRRGSSLSSPWRGFLFYGPSKADRRYLIARFDSAETRLFELSLPPGYEVPSIYPVNTFVIDAHGRLLVPLVANQTVHLHATADGAVWEPLGHPLKGSAGAELAIAEGGGTVAFCRAGSPLSTSQLVGPQGGEGIDLVLTDPGAPENPAHGHIEISTDGACVAYFRSGSVHIIETATMAPEDLGLFADGDSAEMAWVPLP
jgi:hypothetical protein